jgi:hypothetical protein
MVQQSSVVCLPAATVNDSTDGVCQPFDGMLGWSAKIALAKVAELADAPDLGSGSRKALGVQLPPFAPAFAHGDA